MSRVPMDEIYVAIVNEIAKLSYSERSKVAAILIKDDAIISYGYNGMPKGMSNKCEWKSGETKLEVIHAEINCIAKVAKSTYSSNNAIMYCSYSPCIECAKVIIQAGIKCVKYIHLYRLQNGLELLWLNDIETKQIVINEKAETE